MGADASSLVASSWMRMFLSSDFYFLEEIWEVIRYGEVTEECWSLNGESVKYTISGREKVNSLGKFGKIDRKSLMPFWDLWSKFKVKASALVKGEFFGPTRNGILPGEYNGESYGNCNI